MEMERDEPWLLARFGRWRQESFIGLHAIILFLSLQWLTARHRLMCADQICEQSSGLSTRLLTLVTIGPKAYRGEKLASFHNSSKVKNHFICGALQAMSAEDVWPPAYGGREEITKTAAFARSRRALSVGATTFLRVEG